MAEPTISKRKTSSAIPGPKVWIEAERKVSAHALRKLVQKTRSSNLKLRKKQRNNSKLNLRLVMSGLLYTLSTHFLVHLPLLTAKSSLKTPILALGCE